MKIALIFPPYYLESMYNLPPLGLINLATALKPSPHETVIFDFVLALRQGRLSMGSRIYDKCAEMIMAEDPDLVAFSAQCTTYPAVLQIARRVKGAKKDINESSSNFYFNKLDNGHDPILQTPLRLPVLSIPFERTA